MTIKQLTDMHLAQGRFSATYEAEYRRIIDKLPERITRQTVGSVTPMHAAQWWVTLRKDGWTMHRVQRAHEVLSSAFTQAVKLGLVRTSPLRDVAPPKPPQAEITLPSAETLQALVATLEEPCFAALVRVIVSTGVRRGEAVGLKWGDITTGETGARVTVRRAVSYAPRAGVVVAETKTRAKGRRTVPLGVEATAALARWKTVQASRLTLEAVMPESFIFSKTGDEPRRPDWAQVEWAKVCKQAGVKCHLHDLRHLFVSGLLEAGENPVRVARLAGHARTSTTLDIYGHLLEG